MSVSLAHLTYQLARTDRLLQRDLSGGQKGEGFASQTRVGQATPATTGGPAPPAFASGFLAALSLMRTGNPGSSTTDTSTSDAPSLTADGTGTTTSLSGLEEALASLAAEIHSLDGNTSTGVGQATGIAPSATSSSAPTVVTTSASTTANASAGLTAATSKSTSPLSQIASSLDLNLLTTL